MLDWEENVFLGLKAVYNRLRVQPARRRREAVRASLKDRRGTLLLLGQMIAGRPLSLFETNEAVLCRDDRLFLPRECSLAPTVEANAAFYVLKTIIGALAIRDRWNGQTMPPEEWLATCAPEFPHLCERAHHLSAQLARGLWAEFGLPQPTAHPGKLKPAPTAADHEGAVEPSSVTTEIEGKGQSDVEVTLAPEDDGDGAETPMHTFEKVETLEEASGLSRKSDAEDELEEHVEAMEELDMRQVQRSPERPHSIYRSDVILDGLALQMDDAAPGTGIPYPEWDHQRREYRPHWCHVQPVWQVGDNAPWALKMQTRHRSLIHQLKRQFAAVISDWHRLRRQPVGSEFDLEAVVDAEVQRRTGHTAPETIYLDRRRDLRDIAALVLLDQSYSTDAWLENARVLDTITGTVFCAGEVLCEHITKLAVASFSSNTRRSCRFSMLKDFHQSWSTARSRLGSLEPCGYTRIGPALRHAQELLEREAARRKLIILITDGRPCDYDRYEGDYGIHDVKKAIETGAQHGITTHAFAIEKQATEFFPRMFTQRRFDIISRPGRLSHTLCQLFARLVTG